MSLDGPSRAVSISTEATPEAVILLGTDNRAVIKDTARLDFSPLFPDQVEQTRGTVTFELFLGPSELPGSLVFTSGPHPVVADPETATAVVESDPFTPTEPGEYRWRVTYRPDLPGTFELVVLVESSAGELSRVRIMHLPLIRRRATVACRLGQFIRDAIWITGHLDAPFPQGSISFALFGPEDPDCVGPPLMTSVADIRPTEGEPNARSKIFRPTRPGVYRWGFIYPGDENHVPTGWTGGPGGTSVVFEHRPEEHVTVAELGVPSGHGEFNARGRVIFADVVDLLPLPGEVPDE
jgi:hypothetical protein